jgi:hypothetical protein
MVTLALGVAIVIYVLIARYALSWACYDARTKPDASTGMEWDIPRGELLVRHQAQDHASDTCGGPKQWSGPSQYGLGARARLASIRRGSLREHRRQAG